MRRGAFVKSFIHMRLLYEMESAKTPGEEMFS